MRLLTATICTFIILLTASGTALAQLQAQGEPELLIQSSDTFYQNPVWSPDGSAIAFTSARNKGLWVADASGNNITQITDEAAGFGFSWSSDSESILARVSEYENRRRNHAIKIYHRNGEQPTQLTGFRGEMPALPIWANYDEQVLLITDNDIESFDSGKEVPARFKQNPAQSFYVLKSNEIAKGKQPENGTEDISPFEDAVYLNLTVSPDGQKLAFEVYGGNLYVMNVDGTGLIDLGRANNPSWSPDSEYLVAALTEDDGYNFTSSDIYAFKADGTERANLTANSDLVAMNPSWSPDTTNGAKVAFDAINQGAIYVINLAQ